MYKKTDKDNLYYELEESNVIEQLEEIGKINIDFLDYDLDLLIIVLEEYYNLPCEIESLIGGQYLINEHYIENKAY